MIVITETSGDLLAEFSDQTTINIDSKTDFTRFVLCLN